MEKWFLEISGDAKGLETWREQFPRQGDPYLSDFNVHSEDAGTKSVCGIVSRKFVHMDELHRVHDTAETVFEEMKGWVVVSTGGRGPAQDCHLGAVYHLREDGTYRARHIVKATGLVMAAAVISASGGVIGSNGLIRQEVPKRTHEVPKPTHGQFVLSSNDENLKAALRYLAELEVDDWNRLYMVFDALGKVQGLKDSGVSRVLAVRLAQTLNLHRKHNHLPLDAPPMSFRSAHNLILEAIASQSRSL